MFNLNKKQSIILLSVILFLEFVLVNYTCRQKQISSPEELWQITESNAPEPTYGPVDKKIFDRWSSHERWYNNLNLAKANKFSYSRIKKNVNHLTRPILSYFTLHTVSSLSSGKFSKWSMLIPNILLFFISLIILYKMMVFLTGNYLVSNLTVLLYATSRAGLFFVTFIQPYEIYITLSIIACYVHLKIFSYLLVPSFGKGIPTTILYSLIGVAVCYFLGYLDHSYFTVWMFSLSIIVVIVSCLRKNMWFLCNYLIAALVPVLLTWIVYRPSFLFLAGRDGPGFVSTAVSSFFSGSSFSSFFEMISVLNRDIYITHWILTLIIGFIIVLLYRYVKIAYNKFDLTVSVAPFNLTNGFNFTINPRNFSMLAFTLSALLGLYIISSSRAINMGYCCFVIPVFFMLIGYLIRNKQMFIVVAVSFLISLAYLKPTELHWMKYQDETEEFILNDAKQNKIYDMVLYYPDEPNWSPLINYTRYLANARRVYLSSTVEQNIPTEDSTNEIVVFFMRKLYAVGKHDVSDTKLARVSKYLKRPNHRRVAKNVEGVTYIFSR